MKTKKLFFLFIFFFALCLLGQAQVTSFSENFDATSGSNMPVNWSGSAVLGTNYGTGSFFADHTSGTGRFAWESNGYIISALVASGIYNISFWMRISSTPAENVLFGFYIPTGTFTSLQTLNNSNTTWAHYNYTITLPANAFIEWNCAGTSKTHCIDDVNLSPYTGINEQTVDDLKFGFYPMPCGDVINVSMLTGKPSLYEFQLTDISGKIIRNYGETLFGSGTQNEQLDLSGITDGIYFMIIKNQDRKVQVEKIVVVK